MMEILDNELKKYKQSGLESDIPQIASLERLCYQIPLMLENDLLKTYFNCLEQITTKSITAVIVLYFFDNYEDEDAKKYLLGDFVFAGAGERHVLRGPGRRPR